MTLIKASTLAALRAERARQVQLWGEQNHPDGTGTYFDDTNARIARAACEQAFERRKGTWRHILDEEVAEAYAETDPDLLAAELVQVAAVALAWVEAIDRRQRPDVESPAGPLLLAEEAS